MKKILNRLFLTVFFCFILMFFTYSFGSENLNLNALSAVLIDSDTGNILYEKNINKKMYPASTTKILTAILAIENLDLDKIIVVTKTGIDIPWDSARVNLQVGEVITVKDLLYCSLVTSGNDAANMLAEAVSGSVQKFASLMNKKALELGCKNTHFVNPHGYHNSDHYTTTSDMIKILEYALKNETFKNICETKKYVVKKTNKYIVDRKLINTNKLIVNKAENPNSRYYKYALGGKTGSTDEAGSCLIAWSKKEDENLLVAAFKSSFINKEDKRYTDSTSLFEYGFNNFSKTLIFKKYDFNFNIVDKKNNINYALSLEENIYGLTKNNSFIKEVLYDMSSNDFVSFDILDNIKIANKSQEKIYLKFNYINSNGEKYFTTLPFSITQTELNKSIKFNNILNFILYISIIIFIFLILILLLFKKQMRKKTNLQET